MSTIDMSTFNFSERDEFNRKQIADKAIQLLTSPIDVSPMVIDGDWGTGKTEFCHKLKNKFAESHNNYKLIYIDAFQADHADNPLVTILSALIESIPDNNKTDIRKKIIPLMRFITKTATKAGVSYVLKQNADEIADGLEQHIQEATNTMIDASVHALLKDHEEAKKNLAALQTALQKLAEDNPIVIFIDELDRCRPDFAVNILETIKHTLAIPGVKFVLITNTIQLKAAINHKYGVTVNAQRYLDKFLKFSFRLPDYVIGTQNGNDSPKQASAEYFSKLTENSLILKNLDISNQNHGTHYLASSLIRINNLSLREVETFVRYIEIYNILTQGLKQNTIFGYQLLRILGVFCSQFYQNIAETILNNTTDANQITNLLGYKKGSIERHNTKLALLLAQESATNAGTYIWPAEYGRSPEEVKSNYFKEAFPPASLYDVVKETIRSLQLSS